MRTMAIRHRHPKNTFLNGLCALTCSLSLIAGTAYAGTAGLADHVGIGFRYAGRRVWVVARPIGHAAGVRITLVPAERGLKWKMAAGNPALVRRTWPQPVLITRPGPSRIAVGRYWLRVKGSPLTIAIHRANGALLQRLTLRGPSGKIGFDTGGWPLLGLGEGGVQFDRAGHNYVMHNGQGAKLRTDGARIAVPLLIGTRGWALFFLAPWGHFNLATKVPCFEPVKPPGAGGITEPDFMVLSASRPIRLMRTIMRLTGRSVMPPRWALGYLQSCRTLRSDLQMLRIAREFRTRHLPCDAMIYLGTGFCPSGWNTGFGSFTFNPRVFRHLSPATVIRQLRAMHFHVVLHVTPPPHGRLRGTIPPGKDAPKNHEQISWYWLQHVKVFSLGIAGWWADSGDHYGIKSRLARQRMYYQGPLESRPNVRPWSLNRNGYISMVRYGGWIWSGDVKAGWKTLAAQVSNGINTSLSLSPWWGTDTGGFIPTAESSGALFARWFEFSAFCPLFRSHGVYWHTHLPWGWNGGNKGRPPHEKYPLPAELHNPRILPICKKYLDLRYRLLAYNYTLCREVCDRGLPIMRALWLYYPRDAKAAGQPGEYLWGREILVAPVTRNGARSKKVYLPAGAWFNWWTGEKLSGGQTIQCAAPLATIPLFVRAGSVIPLDPIRQYTSEPVKQPMTIRIYPGADARFRLYHDDGRTLDYLHGQYRWTTFLWHNAARQLVIKRTINGTGTAVHPRTYVVRIMPSGPERRITLDKDRTIINFGSPKQR